jgi:hypothetical protein
MREAQPDEFSFASRTLMHETRVSGHAGDFLFRRGVHREAALPRRAPHPPSPARGEGNVENACTPI